jgi:hypothetical protein
MKKKSLFLGCLPLLLMAVFLLVGCPTDDDKTDDPGNNETPRPDISKVDKNGNPIYSYCYVEVNETDPRVAMGYVLDDGKDTPFFDAVVMFSSNLRDRDCAAELAAGETSHRCTKTGVHLHHNGNNQTYYDDVAKYVKPLQDKGIKVIMGLLPDWSGYTYGSFGEWPFEDISPVAGPGHPGVSQGNRYGRGAEPPAAWKDAQGNPKYPYDAAARTKLINEIVDEVVRLGLDGVNIDDEWAYRDPHEYGVPYPGGPQFWYDGASRTSWQYYSTNITDPETGSNFASTKVTEKNNAAWAKMGVQGAQFIVEIREALEAKKADYYHVDLYEYQVFTSNRTPATITWKGKEVTVADYLTSSSNASYGSWKADSTAAGIAHSKFSPMAVDLGHGGNNIRPNVTNVRTQMESYTTAESPYGSILYYGLYSRNRYTDSYSDAGGNEYTPKPNYFVSGTLDDGSQFPAGTMPEEYLSLISEPLYGFRTKYIGDDYPQDFKKF